MCLVFTYVATQHEQHTVAIEINYCKEQNFGKFGEMT